MSVASVNRQQSALGDRPAPANSMPLGKVAYISSAFPALTETFILYEILTMKKLGVNVEIYPLRRLNERITHAEVVQLTDHIHFIPFLSVPVLKAQRHFLLRRPRAYFKVLIEVLHGTFGSANFFLGALAIFPKAVRFAYEMERQAITHVHAQFANHPAVAALIVHRLTNIPFSFTVRGSDIHVEKRMIDRKVEAAAFVIAVSAYNKQVIIDECGPHFRDKIHVIYGGVDTNLFLPRPRRDSKGPLQILCISRFEEVKGQTYLVEACRLLKERGIDFMCHLVGEGPLRGKVEKQIVSSGLSDRVRLYGACTYMEVAKKLSQADIVVLATVPASDGKREGIPNVLKEAMACGLPVVASSISGIPELVEHEQSGLLVQPGDTSALADALERLNDDPALRRQMGRAGRDKVLREFNLATSVAKRAELFTHSTWL